MTEAQYQAQMERFRQGCPGEYYTRDGEYFAGLYETDPEIQRQLDEILAPKSWWQRFIKFLQKAR